MRPRTPVQAVFDFQGNQNGLNDHKGNTIRTMVKYGEMFHYENTPVQIYRRFHLQKLKKKKKKKN